MERRGKGMFLDQNLYFPLLAHIWKQLSAIPALRCWKSLFWGHQRNSMLGITASATTWPPLGPYISTAHNQQLLGIVSLLKGVNKHSQLTPRTVLEAPCMAMRQSSFCSAQSSHFQNAQSPCFAPYKRSGAQSLGIPTSHLLELSKWAN